MRERASVLLCCSVGVAAFLERARLFDGKVRGRRAELLEPLKNLGLGERADEPRDFTAVAERMHGGDTLDAEGRGDVRIRIDVDLRQHPRAVRFAREPLEHRRQLTARAAPLGPEIDDDRHFCGASQDVLLEGRLCDVDDGVCFHLSKCNEPCFLMIPGSGSSDARAMLGRLTRPSTGRLEHEA